jgi:hypothetical protein
MKFLFMSGFDCDNERTIKTSGVKYYTVVDNTPSKKKIIFLKGGNGTPP